MKISKLYANSQKRSFASNIEISDRDIIKNNQQSITNGCRFTKYQLPLESRSHRNYGQIHNSFVAPKSCQIKRERDSETVFSILQYQLKDRQAKQTHLHNLKRNLERRIQSAKAQGNHQLVDLLTKESREIMTFST